MRADDCQGLVITLTKKDKIELDKGNSLEFILSYYKKAKVTFQISDKEFEKDFLEESGIHVEATPPNTSPEKRIRYDVYLSTDRFKQLTTQLDSMDKGYLVTRCNIDRLGIIYLSTID